MKISATAIRFAVAGAALLVMSSAASAQYQRIVLLEEYTSVTCGPCARAGQNLNAIMATYPGRTVSVRYHTNFIPNPKDRFYEANRVENDARKTYYGWVGMPVIRVDGTTEPPATNRTEVESRVTAQMEIESPIRIDVTHQAIELSANEVRTFTYTYAFDAAWQTNQMYAVAFVQDDFDKAVMQAGYSPRPVSSVDAAELAGYAARAAAPNPTTGTARIDYTLGRPGRLEVSVVDAAGAVVAELEPIESSTASGAVSVDLATLGLPAGVYTVALTSGAWSWSDRIVLVR